MIEDFDIRANFPYLIGTYLAVNALPDAVLVVDGPDCAILKAEYVQGNHDWRSTLLSCDGAHRIRHTSATVTNVTADRGEEIGQALRTAAEQPGANVVLLGALPMASVTAPPYDVLLDELRETVTTPLVALPARSLEADWLDGYADTVAALARALPLRKGAPRAENVALVGYLMDRNEEDHGGNLRELSRLIEGLGGRLVCTWLGGRGLDELGAVADAGVVVSLPYAREAARTLAERTGAVLVETGLPMGFDGTSRWLRQVGEAMGREAEAEALVQRELDRVVPRLEWMLPHTLLHCAMGFVGDVHLLRGFVELMGELGARVPYRQIWAGAHHAHDDLTDDALDDPIVLVEPRQHEPAEAFHTICRERNLRLVVGHSLALQALSPRVAAYELGFPSYHCHALYDRPFLGYRGVLSLTQRLAEQMRLHELLHGGGFETIDDRPEPANPQHRHRPDDPGRERA